MIKYTLNNKNRPQEIKNNLSRLDKEAISTFTEIARQRDIKTAKNKELLNDKGYLKRIKEIDLQIEQAKENNGIWWHRFKHLFTDDINTCLNPIHNRKISVFDSDYITYNEALFILLGLNPNALLKDNKKGIIFNRFNYKEVNLFTDRIDQDFCIYDTIENHTLNNRKYKNSEHIKLDDFLVWAKKGFIKFPFSTKIKLFLLSITEPVIDFFANILTSILTKVFGCLGLVVLAWFGLTLPTAWF